MVRAKALRRWLPLLAVALSLGVAGCATLPPRPLPSGVALLPPGTFAYASLDVARNAALVSKVLEESGVAKSIPVSFIERTRRLYAGVERGAAGKNIVSLVAEGSYPSALLRLRLDWSSGWRRMSGPLTWWENGKAGVQVAVPSRNLLLISDGRLAAMLSRLTAAPGEPLDPAVLGPFRHSGLAVYLPQVSGTVPLFGMNAVSLPVQSLFVSLARGAAQAEPYHGYGLLAMKSERDARVYSVVFKLLIASADAGGAIGGLRLPLEGARLSVSGATIRLDGMTIAEKELAALLSRLLSEGKAAEVAQ